jgi:hypothetical protein
MEGFMATKVNQHAVEELLDTLSIREFINFLPGHFFIKNRDGVYIEANFNSKRTDFLDFYGKTDFDMPWKEGANQVRENDKKVMESKKEMFFIEKLSSNGKDLVTFYSVKAPLFDKKGNVVGIIGHATEVEGKK